MLRLKREEEQQRRIEIVATHEIERGEREKQTDRQTKLTDRQTVKQTDRQTDTDTSLTTDCTHRRALRPMPVSSGC